MTTQTPHLDIGHRYGGELVLCLVTIIWGTTFIVIQDALAVWPPMALLAMRFTVAFLCMLPALFTRHSGVGHGRSWWHGAALGFFICIGFGLQTVGLVYTTAARTAFAAALVTVLVPLFALIGLRVRWQAGTYFAAAAAAGGIYLLMGRELGPGVRFGDYLSLASAGGFAVQVMLLGHFARSPGARMIPMLVSQLGVTAALAAAVSWWLGEQLPSPLTQSVEIIAYLGIVTTALCLLGQMYGQARTTSTRAAFIYALEPISAAAFAWLLHGQKLSDVEWMGGTLIVLAAVTADQQLPTWGRRRKMAVALGLTPAKRRVHGTPPSQHPPCARDGHP